MSAKLFKIFTISVMLLCFVSAASSEEKVPYTVDSASAILSERYLGLGAAIGGTASPGMFSFKLNCDYIFDGIFSLGPYLQASFGNDKTYIMMTIDGKGRFSLPGVVPELKLMAVAGAGYLHRKDFGTGYDDFTGKIGFGAEYFIMGNVSVGGEISGNLTSSGTDPYFMNFLAGATYYL